MFVTNCISTTKIQKISEITNFFRHYFLSRTEVYSDLKQKVENVKVSSISIESDDSLLMTNNGRKQLEDSLLLLKSQLSKLQNQLKKNRFY